MQCLVNNGTFLHQQKPSTNKLGLGKERSTYTDNQLKRMVQQKNLYLESENLARQFGGSDLKQ